MATRQLFVLHFLAFVTIEFHYSAAFPGFANKIPNGDKVVNPCNETENWPGVGHDRSVGTGPLNPFGLDFLANEKVWTEALCRNDSDNDGKTNGEELGDPNCTWQFGAAAEGGEISHPGICEPVDSKHCRQQPGNNFLESLDTCADLLGNSASNWCPDATEDPTVKTLELRFDQFNIGSNDTYYMCQTFEVPSDQDYHIIAWEPMIDNRELFHHLILYTCNTPEDDAALVKSGLYHRPEDCTMLPENCSDHMAIVWGYGQQSGRCYPNNTGILMGNQTFGRVILQHHYNNPSHLTNVVDSSGIRIYYTTKLRQIDTSMVLFGQDAFAIPPQLPDFNVSSTTFTSPGCSQTVLAGGKYYFSGLFFHMHKLGTHARVTIQKADGSVIHLVDEDVTYDRPLTMTWDGYETAPYLEAGDNVDIECTYSSVGQSNYTFMGSRTQDEMCYAFVELFGRPMNESFLWLSTTFKMDYCVWYDWEDGQDRVIDGCSANLLYTGFNLLGQNIIRRCGTQPYPATSCSSLCLGTIVTAQMAGITADHPCLHSELLKIIALEYTESQAKAYAVLSQLDLCINELITELETTTVSKVTATLPPSLPASTSSINSSTQPPTSITPISENAITSVNSTSSLTTSESPIIKASDQPSAVKVFSTTPSAGTTAAAESALILLIATILTIFN